MSFFAAAYRRVGAEHRDQRLLTRAARRLVFRFLALVPGLAGDAHPDVCSARKRQRRLLMDEITPEQLLFGAVAQLITHVPECLDLLVGERYLLPSDQIEEFSVPHARRGERRAPAAVLHPADRLPTLVLVLRRIVGVPDERLVIRGKAVRRVSLQRFAAMNAFDVRVSGFLAQPHQRRRIRRRATAAAVIGHLIAEQLNVLALDLDVHRPWTDEFARSVRIGRNESATRTFAGRIAHAAEAGAFDRDELTFDLDRRAVVLRTVARFSDVRKRCRNKRRRGPGHLADVRQCCRGNTVAALGHRSLWIIDADTHKETPRCEPTTSTTAAARRPLSEPLQTR